MTSGPCPYEKVTFKAGIWGHFDQRMGDISLTVLFLSWAEPTWCSSCESGSPGKGPGWGWWSGHRSHTAPWPSFLRRARSAAPPPDWRRCTLKHTHTAVSVRSLPAARRPSAQTHCGYIDGSSGGFWLGAAPPAERAGSGSGSGAARQSACSRGVCRSPPCSWILPATSCPQAPSFSRI